MIQSFFQGKQLLKHAYLRGFCFLTATTYSSLPPHPLSILHLLCVLYLFSWMNQKCYPSSPSMKASMHHFNNTSAVFIIYLLFSPPPPPPPGFPFFNWQPLPDHSIHINKSPFPCVAPRSTLVSELSSWVCICVSFPGAVQRVMC